MARENRMKISPRSWLLLPMLALTAAAAQDRPFVIKVVDEATGRGVPLVELRTVNEVSYWTDSAGVVTLREPAFRGKETFFYVRSHGYERVADGFGIRGVRVTPMPGDTVKVPVKRLNVAERLYRVTGEGIYRDSVLAGLPVPLKEPLLNGRVMGSDSVQTAVYGDRLFWIWGDTIRPEYPLGNFDATGATTALPGNNGLDPDKGVDLKYFVGANGAVRGMAPVPGPGPTWLTALTTLRDEAGKERLFAGYLKIRNLLEVYERGVVRFDDERGVFEKIAEVPLTSPAFPSGHTTHRQSLNVKHVYFGDPFPMTRVLAKAKSFADTARYESFTCLKPGSTLAKPEIVRSKDGAPQYDWRTGAPEINPEDQQSLEKRGVLKPDEGLIQLRDIETGKPVIIHRGTVNWNEYRKRFVMVATEIGGTSQVGEAWYAEADTALGPWVYARKIVTHENYSFYNPVHHVLFDQDGGRRIYFEGTYTQTFSGSGNPTPRYEYNQMMYRLTLDDSRLVLPVPVYYRSGTFPGYKLNQSEFNQGVKRLDFMALDRTRSEAIAVYAPETVREDREAPRRRMESDILFYALPADLKNPPPGTTPLYAFHGSAGLPAYYSIDPNGATKGYTRLERPVCRVWRNPCRITLPAL